MGREATRREMSPEQAGMEVFGMELLNGGGNVEAAVRAAIEAAVATAHRGFIQGTRADILEKAEDLDDDEESDLVEDGVAALLWYAKLLDETLPPELRLENNDA